ncbi:hypothetical protein SLS60_004763 [Paraconiothyrium brasiliense]|uniref:Auxin efflux carrier n=1 Tax=Paraconiothyrium brasiliense TaxID=300254 RepID=A0ABR3RM61_9PLEO
MSTTRSSFSQSPDSRLSVPGLGISTAGTTPEDAAQPLRRKLSAASLLSIALGPGALQWNKLCRKTVVERVTPQGSESRECDLHWRYREDAGISIRSVYRSGSSKEVKVWITQHFPATGPSIPLTTSFPDGDVAIDFPRSSYGRLEKRCTDVKYLMSDTRSSEKLQTLLYTNNGKEGAQLLYDRPILSISSNLNKPECRGKNLRLWKKTEVRVGLNGLESADILVLLFYTSALPEEKAHWVEEPHHVFQWLDDSTYSKSSDKLQLIFSKEPGKWTRDKVIQRRTSSTSSEVGEGEMGTGLSHAGTRTSIASASAGSVTSARSSVFTNGPKRGAGANLNRFGYSELEIKFQRCTCTPSVPSLSSTMGMDKELVVPLVGALQASISVLITIFFGVLTAQFNLLSTGAAKEVSRACVRMFLPALLIYKLGTNLDTDTGVHYVPILIWSISYTLISLGISAVACRVFKLPNWVKLAVTFNNTTSLPLLLIQSLSTTGVLDAIIPSGDDASKALDRAESYFLINAMVSNSLTFALGPRLLRPSDEDAPDDSKEGEEVNSEGEDSPERGPDGIIDEETSLLPQRAVRPINRAERRGYKWTTKWVQSLPPWAQQLLDFLYQFANAPLLGTLVGAIIGLTPPLHRLFFNDSNDGGYFNAWLTTAIKNVGELFATTQIIVVGVKLSQSLRKMKAGEESGTISKKSMAFVFLMRFFFWPAVSIPLIYALATKTNVLSSDPMLWFAMMLMSSGPSAMILVALTDVTKSPEEEKMVIAKFLTISYAITPLICFAVVGSLKATEAAVAR